METKTQVTQARPEAIINERANRIEWDLGSIEAYARAVITSKREQGALVIDEIDAEELVAEAVQQSWLYLPSEEKCPDDSMAQIWAIRSALMVVLQNNWLASRVITRGRYHKQELVAWNDEAPAPITMSEYKRFFRELDAFLTEVGLRNTVAQMSHGFSVDWRKAQAARIACRGFCHDFATERRIS